MDLPPERDTECDELGWPLDSKEYHEALTKHLAGAVIKRTRAGAGDSWALELEDGRTFMCARPIRADQDYREVAKRLRETFRGP